MADKQDQDLRRSSRIKKRQLQQQPETEENLMTFSDAGSQIGDTSEPGYLHAISSVESIASRRSRASRHSRGRSLGGASMASSARRRLKAQAELEAAKAAAQLEQENL